MNTRPTITVAIADDHTLFVNGLVHLLHGQQGISVTLTAADGQELIDKLEHADVLPHVCLLDINMPRENGYEVMPVIAGRWPFVKVIALSMYSEEEYPVLKMIADGACGFLGKDAAPQELPEAIRQVHLHGYYSGGAAANFLPHGPATVAKLLVNITDNELQFLQLSCTALDYHEIAQQMGKSRRTIDNYRDNLFRKLDITNRAGLSLFACRAGLNNY